MSKDHENKFLRIIQNDQWLMNLLKTVKCLELNEWAIAAGSVRNTVWDNLHGYDKKTLPSDIDVLFFDSGADNTLEKEIENRLNLLIPDVHWEAVNQATIHSHNKDLPYASIEHALSRWTDPSNAVGVYLDENNNIKYYAPHGLSDLMQMVVRPHLVAAGSKEIYMDRVTNKGWKKKWPMITIIMPD